MVQKTDWSNLPNKILNIVFLYLKKSDKNGTQEKDLSQCALTCRGWRYASQVVFFSDIRFRSKNDFNNLCQLLLGNSGNLGVLIKTLSFEGTILDNSIGIAILLAVDLQIPNLEDLNFSGGDNLLYSSFTKMITENGKFKNLKKLPLPANKKQDKLYLQCVDYLKDRIATIDLFRGGFNNRSALYSSFYTKLNCFPNLKNAVLHVSSSNYISSQNFIKKIESILDSNLASLRQLLITSFKNNQHYLCFRFLREDSLRITIYNSSFGFLNFGDEIMTFIMNRFSNLKSVYLERTSDENREASMPESPTSPTEVVFQFTNYLSKVPNCNLGQTWLDTQNAIKIIKYICDNSSKNDPKLTVVSEFLILDEDRQLLFDLPNLDDRPLSTIYFKNKQLPSTVQRMIYFTSLYEEEDYNNSNCQIQLNLIEETGCFLDCLCLQIFRNTNLDTLLNYVAIHCKRLIYLKIFGLDNLPLSNTISEGEETIRTCRTMRALSLPNCIPTPGEFVCILKRLPSLSMLFLENCFTQNSWSGERYFSICLPNVKLALLQITMNEKLFDTSESEAYYIKLVTDVRNKVRYCRVTVKYNRYKGVVGYSVLKDVEESDFQKSFVNSKMSSCLIYCKSVRQFRINYLSAEDGRKAMVNI